MARQTIEFPNNQGLTEPFAMWGVSSNPLDISAEPRSNTPLRRDQPSRFATAAELYPALVHQLRESLTSMLANAQAAKRWLAAEATNLEKALASMDRIARDARATDRTMERMLALFKQEPLDMREASVAEMMSEAVRLVLEDPNKREIPIECHFDENLPKACGAPLAIREVFINLVSNAMEALANTKSPLVEVRASTTDQNEMLVQVIDNGPGIGDTGEIFDAFVTAKKSGLWAGLAVSRSIVEAHGGRLWAENGPDGGARFNVALPLSPMRSE
jgi:signal transduction histidine kinase